MKGYNFRVITLTIKHQVLSLSFTCRSTFCNCKEKRKLNQCWEEQQPMCDLQPWIGSYQGGRRLRNGCFNKLLKGRVNVHQHHQSTGSCITLKHQACHLCLQSSPPNLLYFVTFHFLEAEVYQSLPCDLKIKEITHCQFRAPSPNQSNQLMHLM